MTLTVMHAQACARPEPGFRHVMLREAAQLRDGSKPVWFQKDGESGLADGIRRGSTPLVLSHVHHQCNRCQQLAPPTLC